MLVLVLAPVLVLVPVPVLVLALAAQRGHGHCRQDCTVLVHGTSGPAGSDTLAGSAAGPELASGHAAARSGAGCPPVNATAAAGSGSGSGSAIG